MKKLTFLACAALLTSAVALTGCKGDQNAPAKIQEEVKTEFAVTLPQQLQKNRMPSANVQRDGLTQFQGITGIFLVPFAKQGAIESTDLRLGNNIVLSGDVSSADASKPSSAKVYSDVSIPLTTSSFLFYGKSAATGDKSRIGSLNYNCDNSLTTPAGFTFDLEQIKSDFSTVMASSGKGGQLLQYLTNIACASDGDLSTPKMWYEYTNAEDAGMKAMFDTYASIHGLSSFEVNRVLTDLYVSLKPLSSPIATAIKDSINDGDYIKTDVLAAYDKVELKDDLNNFPGEYGLPDGSVDMKWDATLHKFIEGDYSNMARPNNYVYPAQLWYYVNSTIKTSNTSKKTMYDNTNNWSTILAAHEASTSVNSRTRAVAIKDLVQYAVARLDVAVKLSNAALADNSETATGIATTVDCSGGFPVRGIIVGGQKQVGFDFTPKGSTEYTIYDHEITSTHETTPADMVATNGVLSAYNHTLVLETVEDVDVMVAVELQNTTGADFYGVDNLLIPKNGKFYVVAKLVGEDADQTGDKVFKQDYITIANLTLKDLKHAYSTLPDLRTPQLELGFSVDLTWQAGHTYNIDFE